MRTSAPHFPALLALGGALCLPPAGAADVPAPDKDPLEQHTEGSRKLAIVQDELAADVQELIDLQTVEPVIRLLEEVEAIMAEVTFQLDESKTGGPTIAAETEIIEKIFAAAKKRAQQSNGNPSESDPTNGAMLDMMERMMGREPQPGQQPGNMGGEGQTGDSDSANKNPAEGGEGRLEQRRVPKSSGPAGSGLPPEFQKALDAYNKDR